VQALATQHDCIAEKQNPQDEHRRCCREIDNISGLFTQAAERGTPPPENISIAAVNGDGLFFLALGPHFNSFAKIIR
jgi:hypothetical protein